jgi:two-component system, NarL family, response regulator
VKEPDAIRILIADDHPVVREGLSALINRRPDMKVVAEAGDGRGAVEQFFLHRPDVALIDLRMPEMDAVEVIAAVRQRTPDARLIVLTTFDGDEDIYRALRAGAKAYLLKDARREELLDCIRTVHAGGSWMAPYMAAKLADRLSGRDLSAREVDVLRLLVEGKSNKEIGATLFISEGTVKVHVNHILEKLGAEGRTAASVEALKRGIVHLK